VNTEEVVVRSIQTEGGHAEYSPIGHSTGLAARLRVRDHHRLPFEILLATQSTPHDVRTASNWPLTSRTGRRSVKLGRWDASLRAS